MRPKNALFTRITFNKRGWKVTIRFSGLLLVTKYFETEEKAIWYEANAITKFEASPHLAAQILHIKQQASDLLDNPYHNLF